jgi:sensor histidine kinase YesM
LNSKLKSYAIDQNFKRVSFFTRKGDILTSEYRTASKQEFTSGDINPVWLKQAEALKGQPCLIIPHEDSWAAGKPDKVFSIIRAIQGMNEVGFLEVQQDYGKITDIFSNNLFNNDPIQVFAFTDQNEIFYSSFTNNRMSKYYMDSFHLLKDQSGFYKNPYTGFEELIAGYYSNYTHIHILLMQDKKVILQSVYFSTKIVIVVILLVLAASILYLIFSINHLMRPVRELRHQIE